MICNKTNIEQVTQLAAVQNTASVNYIWLLLQGPSHMASPTNCKKSIDRQKSTPSFFSGSFCSLNNRSVLITKHVFLPQDQD